MSLATTSTAAASIDVRTRGGCVYFDKTRRRWSDRGVYSLGVSMSDRSILCATHHFSSFTANAAPEVNVQVLKLNPTRLSAYGEEFSTRWACPGLLLFVLAATAVFTKVLQKIDSSEKLVEERKRVSETLFMMAGAMHLPTSVLLQVRQREEGRSVPLWRHYWYNLRRFHPIISPFWAPVEEQILYSRPQRMVALGMSLIGIMAAWCLGA